MNKTTLIIPDLHLPFCNTNTFSFLSDIKKKYKPTDVVMIGDLVDQHQLSTFVKGGNTLSTDSELYSTEEGVKKLIKLFPKMKVCRGNHDSRYLKRAKEVGLTKSYLKSFEEIIQAPKGWEFGDEFEIDGVLYFHGDGYTGINASSNVIKTKFQSCVFGHTHQASIQYLNTGKSTYFAMNVGCLINEEAYCFEYAKYFKTKPIQGCGIVYNFDGILVPHFIPLS